MKVAGGKLMTLALNVVTVTARPIAAVRRRLHRHELAEAWKPALDLVWELLRRRPDLRADGHNVFLYHHPQRDGDPMEIDFGVLVTRSSRPTAQ